MIYFPAEDSHLLEKQVQIHAFGRVLDLGTGSGIQALAALSNHDVGEVVAVDIDEEAVNQLKDKIKSQRLRKISVIKSNLFENVEGKFNTIIFNPPYLPQDKVAKEIIEDKTIYGGKKGWELSERFFKEVSRHLAADGLILFLFSSLTNKDKIDKLIQDNLLQYKLLDQQKLAFEELYVYEITKTPVLRKLESKGLEEITFLAKGKRGVIYTAISDKSKLVKTHLPSKRNWIKVAIKIKKEDSKAKNSITNEINWLKVLNQKDIGPKLLFYEENFLVYEFVDGMFILDYIQTNSKFSIVTILKSVLEQCYILDNLRINKQEMHHPLKHIIVTKENKPILIDFERASKSMKAKNVTQFIEFICRSEQELLAKGLKVDKQKFQFLAQRYKDQPRWGIIEEVLSNL